jgi:hypothetical protein
MMGCYFWGMNFMPVAAVLYFLISVGVRAEEKGVELADYWLMPNNLVAKFCNVTLEGDIIFGEHCFWNGEFLGRQCFLQGDPSMTKYDIFEIHDGTIRYWGTFRGNKAENAVSHVFRAPILWMRKRMAVGDILKSQVPVEVLSPDSRSVKHQGEVEMRIEINDYYENWLLPETGVSYENVIKVTFWSDAKNPSAKEIYHLAKGKGTVHFVSSNKGEPSGVRTAWAVEFGKKEITKPITPWYQVFGSPQK